MSPHPPRPIVGLIIGLLLGFLAGYNYALNVDQAHAASPIKPPANVRLDILAQQLTTLDDVTVDCFAPNYEDGGFVYFIDGKPEHIIHLDGRYCGALKNVLYPGPRTAHWLTTFDGGESVGWAYEALVHEALHIRLAQENEGIVECTTVRNAWDALSSYYLPLKPKVRKHVYQAMLRKHRSIIEAYPYYGTVC